MCIILTYSHVHIYAPQMHGGVWWELRELEENDYLHWMVVFHSEN